MKPQLSNKECNSRDNYNGQVSGSMTCAQAAQNTRPQVSYSHYLDISNNKNVFQTAAGSPLLCLSSSGSWHLAGLLAHKPDTSSRERPLVFSSVMAVRDWIDSTIG